MSEKVNVYSNYVDKTPADAVISEDGSVVELIFHEPDEPAPIEKVYEALDRMAASGIDGIYIGPAEASHRGVWAARNQPSS